MNAPNKTLTPSQLAQLEQAYAKAPAEGWSALAEAYLARGRYMEAMVVAKRGSRARPDDPAPHLMLARVHGAQRKFDKARLAVSEALKLGPQDPAVLAAAREHGLVAPEPPQASAPTPAEPGADGAAPAPTTEELAAQDAAAGVERESRSRWTDELAQRFGEPDPEDRSTRRKRAKRGLLRTVALAVALGAALAGAAGYVSSQRAREDEQQRLLGDAKRLLEKDSWSGYRDAQAACEKAASLGGDAAPTAYGCAAWAATVRWAEHGEGEPLRAKAVEHLSRSGPEAARPRDAILASAWLKLHEGDARGAAELLRARGGENGNAPLKAALGVALGEAGDADGARDALMAAQQLAPGSPRIAQQLADLLRKRGGEGVEQATMLYEIVLQKLSPDHAPAMLGKAHLLLDAKDGGAAFAAAQRVADLKDQVSPRQRARALALQARALALLGKKPEADAAEREARSIDASAPELREPLAHARP